MIPGLPNPYIILVAGLAWLGSMVGAALWYGGVRDDHWQAATAKLQTEAAVTLAAETAKAAQKDAENAELANRIDQVATKAAQDAANSRDDFARRLLIARRGARCSGPAAAETPNPGSRADVAPSGDGGSGGADSALHLRDAALELQRYAVACHSFAIQVGR